MRSLLRNAAANVLAAIGKDAVTVVFLVGVMFYQDWLLALSCPSSSSRWRSGRSSGSAGGCAGSPPTPSPKSGQLTTLLSQTFQGARHVKAYGMEQYEERRAAALIERLFALIDRANRTRSRASPMMEALGGAAIAIVILYGGHQVIAGARTPGAFFSFITALLLAYQPMKSLANLNASLQEGLAAAQRVFEVLDIEPAIRDLPGRPAAAHRRRRDPLRRCPVRLHSRDRRARRHFADHTGRQHGRAGRAVGRREVDNRSI